MLIDIDCPHCNGEGWTARRDPRLGRGVFELTCERCFGHGAIEVDPEAEIEEWML